MTLCALCGLESGDHSFLCRFHGLGTGDDWAKNNKAICDLIHRGVELPRLSKEERGDSEGYWDAGPPSPPPTPEGGDAAAMIGF